MPACVSHANHSWRQSAPESSGSQAIAVGAGLRRDALEVGVVGVLEIDHHPLAGPITKDQMNVVCLSRRVGRNAQAVVGQ